MTVVLHLDSEQAALVEAALEFGVAALAARAQRIDPNKAISDSHQLQSIKLQQVKDQMQVAPLPTYSAMSTDDRARTIALAQALTTVQKVGERDEALAALMDHCDVCRLKTHKA